MKKYYTLLSGLSIPEIEARFADLDSGKLHPKQVKSDFAVELITRFHSADAARQATQHFERVFSRKEAPEEMPEFDYAGSSDKVWLPDLLKAVGFVKSTSEGKRLVAQGAVKVDGEAVREENWAPKSPVTLQCGKRKFAKINIK